MGCLLTVNKCAIWHAIQLQNTTQPPLFLFVQNHKKITQFRQLATVVHENSGHTLIHTSVELSVLLCR